MKLYIAYGLVVIGLPHAVGLLAGLPFARFIARDAEPGQMYHSLAKVDLINGVGCLAAAVLLFRILDLEMTLVLPIVLCLRSAVYFFPKQQFLMGVYHIVGIVGGWIAYTAFFTK